MKNPFLDKNDDWEIIKAVRLDQMEPKEGVKRIFNLILLGHGQVGIVDDTITYLPSINYHIYYMENSSSVIRMSEGTGTPMTQEVKLATLEDWQYWENEMLSLNVDLINQALEDIETDEKSIYLDARIHKIKRSLILSKHNISKWQFYMILDKLDSKICMRLGLYSDKRDEESINYIIKVLKKSDERTGNNTCQEIIEEIEDRRKLIETLYLMD